MKDTKPLFKPIPNHYSRIFLKISKANISRPNCCWIGCVTHYKRGDEVSAVIHGGKILECICQLSYLLDQKPYPHAKWISFYLETTTFGKLKLSKDSKFSRDISSKKELPKHLPLFFYSQYCDGKLLCNALAKKISELYGDQPWIKEWYNFV